MKPRYYGWRVVATCFVIASFGWGLGLYGASVYLQAITAAHAWPVSSVATAITVFFLVSAAAQRSVGRSIDRWGPRPVLTLGALSMAAGVILLGQIVKPWQLYPGFVLIGLGWSTLSTTGISATVAPWFERHQGRSITLAVMGASMGAIVGVPLLLLALARLGLTGGLTAAGLLAAAILLPLVTLQLRYRGPAELGLRPDGDAPPEARASRPPERPLANPENRRVLLWSTSAGFALALTVQIGFITHHLALAEPLLGKAGAGMLISASGLVALLGRLVLARIVDRINVRHLAAGIMFMQTLALLAMACFPVAPVLIGASLVYGYAIGHVTTLAPVIVRREFGSTAFGATYGSAATFIQFASAFGPALLGILRDAFGGYATGLALSALATLVASAALYFGERSPTPP